jgi:Tripartite tricarboxylate transporter TctB family
MSEPSNSDHADSPVVAKNNTVDAVVAAVLTLIGVVVMFEAKRLGAGWTTDGPGSGYFPFYIGLILCISGVGIIYEALFSKKRDTGAFVNQLQLQRVTSVLVPAAVYVLMVTFFGLYVASAVYIALFMILMGKYPVLRSVVLAVLIIALFFLMFEVWFKVPLYKGTLEPLRFLRY